MPKRLQTLDPSAVRNRYNGNPVYQLLTNTSAELCTQFAGLDLLPEDVFQMVMADIDHMKVYPADAANYCQRYHPTCHQRIKRMTDTPPCQADTDLAIGIVGASLAVCMAMTDDPVWSQRADILIHGLETRIPVEFNRAYTDIRKWEHQLLGSGLELWLNQYVNDPRQYSTAQDGTLLLDDEKEEEDSEAGDTKAANVHVRARLLLDILQQCGMGTDRQDATKVCRLAAFIIGTSHKYLLNNLGKKLNAKTHKKDIDTANKFLADLEGVDLRLKC